MAIQRLPIASFLAQSAGGIVLDVRSPAEYQHAHMPGAISFPLFSDEERKVVGTLYKQQSREEAIKAGLDLFGPRMRTMVEAAETLVKERISDGGARDFYLYCWRGGMRSAAVAWLLDLYGFRVFVLAGGYKTYRQHVLQSFEKPYQFSVVGGYTGSGKTEVLRELQQLGETVIDLEAVASHKGSAFGNYKMPPQPSQEMFENLFSRALDNAVGQADPESVPIWVEDESQRIGDINLPLHLWNRMRSAPVLFLEVPFEERLNHIVEEYGSCPKEKLADSIQRISKRLGPQHAKQALEHLEAGNIKEAFHLLLLYYDKRYLKGLHNREDLSALLTSVKCATVNSANARLLTKQPL